MSATNQKHFLLVHLHLSRPSVLRNECRVKVEAPRINITPSIPQCPATPQMGPRTKQLWVLAAALWSRGDVGAAYLVSPQDIAHEVHHTTVCWHLITHCSTPQHDTAHHSRCGRRQASHLTHEEHDCVMQQLTPGMTLYYYPTATAAWRRCLQTPKIRLSEPCNTHCFFTYGCLFQRP